MRPQGTLSADFPGTVRAAAGGLCSSCYQRAYRAGKGVKVVHRDPAAPVKVPLTAEQEAAARVVARRVRRLDERAVVLAELGLE